MAEKKVQKIKAQSDYLSDSESSEDEVNPHLCTSQEERVYGTIKGSTQATQAALSHTTMQCNPMVERGPLKQPKIKKLSKEQAANKATQTKEKEKPLYLVTFYIPISSYICDFILPYISSFNMNASS